MKVYLDNAATTPLAPEVLEHMMPYLTEHFGNPSSTHSFGRKTKTAIENARRAVAKALNCAPSEIFFTSGGTEADNLALHTAVRDLGCTHIITSAIEHSAVIKTAELLSKEKGVKLSLVKLTSNGHVDLQHLEDLLATHPHSFVTLMHGNNEIANLLPLEKVGQLCQQYGAYFHSDTVQTMGHYKLDLQQIPIHFINAAGHKFHGPKGVGFIYINKQVKINPDITGGGQERGMRGGTENLYGIVGISKALELANEHIDEHAAHISGLKQYMIARLKEEVPGISFNGDSESKDSLYTVLSTTFPPTSNSDMMLFLLDLEGVAASGGSACSSGATKGSHVLDAINALKTGCASIRFSFGRYTTKEEIDFTIEKIKQLVQVPQMA
ncbi:MAG: cysteine desulfurase family protein [Flavobacteriales bacterium]|jgi:cysteine desulfurase